MKLNEQHQEGIDAVEASRPQVLLQMCVVVILISLRELKDKVTTTPTN